VGCAFEQGDETIRLNDAFFFHLPRLRFPIAPQAPLTVEPFFLQLSATERTEIGLARTPTPRKEGDREGKKKENQRRKYEAEENGRSRKNECKVTGT
jgi:hypothetical protein